MDIYFDEKYGKLYEIKNKEVLETYNYYCEFGKVKYIFLKRKIDILSEELYDVITPYGYGGPYFYDYKEENMEHLVNLFEKEFEKYCLENKIVSEFIRFHPFYDYYEKLKNHINIINLSSTIFMKLENKEQVLSDMDGKARNMIRKAEKNELVFQETTIKDIEKFIEIYYGTMEKNSASQEYFFEKEYFYDIFENLKNNVKLFIIKINEEIIGGSLILIGDRDIHYHLSGNTEQGYKLSANNFLLYRIALWGIENGFKRFHLGGGYGGDESSLFKFKKAMAKNNVLKFYIGKKIHNFEKYSQLVEKKLGKRIEITTEGFFPLYRK